MTRAAKRQLDARGRELNEAMLRIDEIYVDFYTRRKIKDYSHAINMQMGLVERCKDQNNEAYDIYMKISGILCDMLRTPVVRVGR